MRPARTALVTGAGRGIGAAAALALAAAGCRVAVGARTRAEVEATAAHVREAGGEALALVGDLRRPETAREWLEGARAAFGEVAILVNNAGDAPSARIEETSDEDMEGALALHVQAPFRLCRAVVPAMKAAGFGRIVNVASNAGVAGWAYVSAYVAAKHALVGLTRALAAELAGTGVTANAVCPGFTETEMTRASARHVAGKTGRPEPEALRKLASLNRHGRLVAPEEVARCVAFLAGEEAGSINGQCLIIDGGTVLS